MYPIHVHACFLFTQAGANKDGKIHVIDVEIYCNGGYSADLSQAVSHVAICGCSLTIYGVVKH